MKSALIFTSNSHRGEGPKWGGAPLNPAGVQQAGAVAIKTVAEFLAASREVDSKAAANCLKAITARKRGSGCQLT